jgi:hypothetical protein
MGMWQEWGREKGHTEFCWGHLGERDHLEDLGVDGGINITIGF